MVLGCGQLSGSERMRLHIFIFMSYRKLEIWQLAREVSIEIHRMSLTLPNFEVYETGSQIRRSSKSTRSNIVEGYGRRVYKQEFIRFLTFALASNDETIDHLDTLIETGSVQNDEASRAIREKIEILGRKLNRFMSGVYLHHNTKDKNP